MRKKSLESSRPGKRTAKNAKPIPDDKIDYSDIPELSDAQLKAMKPVGRPLLGGAPRKLIAVRIDPMVLDQLRRKAKKAGKGDQTLINEILAKFVGKKAA
jgi:uncharacterized protein (DUF4415 family)